MPIGIDRWAYDLAQRVAKDTGWLASDIYVFIVDRRADYEELTIMQSVETIARHRLAGESFVDAAQRMVALAVEIIEEEEW